MTGRSNVWTTAPLVNSITATLSPGQTARYETSAAASLQVAWAILTPATLGAERLAGLAIFRQTVPTAVSEAVVDFVGPTQTKYVMLYDNVGGFVTTCMLANPDPVNPLTIQVDIRDAAGAIIATDTVILAPLGHTAFEVPLRFPSTVNKRGSIRFSGGAMTGLGIRFSPNQTFTSFRFQASKDMQ